MGNPSSRPGRGPVTSSHSDVVHPQRTQVTNSAPNLQHWTQVGAGQLNANQRTHQPAQVVEAKVLKNPVNLKKKTLKIVRDERDKTIYYLTFEFDATTPCIIVVRYVVTENTSKTNSSQVPVFKLVVPESQPFRSKKYPAGLKQIFKTNKPDALDISKHSLEDLTGGKDNVFPVVIELKAEGASASETSRQLTYASLTKNESGDSWTLAIVKQKIQIGDQCREIREIFGAKKVSSVDNLDPDDLLHGRECVICLEQERDTAVVPCRHMCLCQSCAEILRLQKGNKCPICREPVSSLIHMRSTPASAHLTKPA
eukprot:Platyproteum_vivax@DN14739_c0_g1_i1.p1